MNEIRNDIQVLRAIAVLSVIFYHFNIFSFKGGYLGVDIFFVISGFLVTQMITKGLTNNNFSFIEFYIRRAKRLLPATYSTFFITSIFSFLLLTSKELYDFLHHLAFLLQDRLKIINDKHRYYFYRGLELYYK